MNECHYSFSDLFQAAHKRPPENQEAMEFVLASQDARNTLVKKWAILAGWATEDRVGTDGKIYTAFAPKLEE